MIGSEPAVRSIDPWPATPDIAPADPTVATRQRPSRAAPLATAVVASAGVGLAAWAALDRSRPIWWVTLAVIVVWSASALVVTVRLPRRNLGLVIATVAVASGAMLAATAVVADGEGDDGRLGRAITVALLAAALTHLALSLPEGRLVTRRRQAATTVAYVGAIGLGVASGGSTELPVLPYLIWTLLLGGTAVAGYGHRCARAGAADRARLQWVGWGVVMAVATAGVIAGVHALVDWPPDPALVALAFTVYIPLAFAASTFDRLAATVDRVLVHTIIIAGLVGLVVGIYLVVVIGLGRVPGEAERPILVSSMVAAALSALLAVWARDRLEELANERIYGEQKSPDEALRTFAGRMTRAVPMDELLLQLAESLKKSMHLAAAEVWTGTGGTLDRVVSVPHREERRVTLKDEELLVMARAHVQGNAWLQVWAHSLLADREEGRLVRVAAMAHGSELLGLLVAERTADSVAFTDEESRVLTELARQVGMALHNVSLDTALQASLAELQHRNAELQASRLRIVTAADESRRQIERNLHDGAQQHLVALAVKVGLVKQLLSAEPETAGTLLDQLRGDVQATLTELRELAHGIYPPLLRDRGLPEALRTAAYRAVLPTEVVSLDVGRYASEVEAAVYFCCLEALQNAGKYGGDGAEVTITVSEIADELRFEVADDGAGFDPAVVAMGRGFENMRDRLGAIGGDLDLSSTPGSGSLVAGRIPLDEANRGVCGAAPMSAPSDQLGRHS
ncbi:hypothetical protein BH23ACT3_BH23ACT3_15730 [soil metagenome]